MLARFSLVASTLGKVFPRLIPSALVFAAAVTLTATTAWSFPWDIDMYRGDNLQPLAIAPRVMPEGTMPVSGGEVLAIAPLVAVLRARGYRVVVSTTTHTGQRLARERFGEAHVFYFPLDLGVCIRPYLRALRPQLVILAETEFWPNFLRLARSSGAHLAVVNARISDRSYPRYRRWRALLRVALEPLT